MLTTKEFKQISTSIYALRTQYIEEDESVASNACELILNILETYTEEEKEFFEISELNWEESLQYLCINENNNIRFELWWWHNDFDHQYMFKQLKQNDTDEAEIYKNIKKHAKLIKDGKTFTEIFSRGNLEEIKT